MFTVISYRPRTAKDDAISPLGPGLAQLSSCLRTPGVIAPN
jgi:hypothetical protein